MRELAVTIPIGDDHLAGTLTLPVSVHGVDGAEASPDIEGRVPAAPSSWGPVRSTATRTPDACVST